MVVVRRTRDGTTVAVVTIYTARLGSLCRYKNAGINQLNSSKKIFEFQD